MDYARSKKNKLSVQNVVLAHYNDIITGLVAIKGYYLKQWFRLYLGASSFLRYIKANKIDEHGSSEIVLRFDSGEHQHNISDLMTTPYVAK